MSGSESARSTVFIAQQPKNEIELEHAPANSPKRPMLPRLRLVLGSASGYENISERRPKRTDGGCIDISHVSSRIRCLSSRTGVLSYVDTRRSSAVSPVLQAAKATPSSAREPIVPPLGIKSIASLIAPRSPKERARPSTSARYGASTGGSRHVSRRSSTNCNSIISPCSAATSPRGACFSAKGSTRGHQQACAVLQQMTSMKPLECQTTRFDMPPSNSLTLAAAEVEERLPSSLPTDKAEFNAHGTSASAGNSVTFLGGGTSSLFSSLASREELFAGLTNSQVVVASPSPGFAGLQQLPPQPQATALTASASPLSGLPLLEHAAACLLRTSSSNCGGGGIEKNCTGATGTHEALLAVMGFHSSEVFAHDDGLRALAAQTAWSCISRLPQDARCAVAAELALAIAAHLDGLVSTVCASPATPAALAARLREAAYAQLTDHAPQTAAQARPETCGPPVLALASPSSEQSPAQPQLQRELTLAADATFSDVGFDPSQYRRRQQEVRHSTKSPPQPLNPTPPRKMESAQLSTDSFVPTAGCLTPIQPPAPPGTPVPSEVSSSSACAGASGAGAAATVGALAAVATSASNVFSGLFRRVASSAPSDVASSGVVSSSARAKPFYDVARRAWVFPGDGEKDAGAPAVGAPPTTGIYGIIGAATTPSGTVVGSASAMQATPARRPRSAARYFDSLNNVVAAVPAAHAPSSYSDANSTDEQQRSRIATTFTPVTPVLSVAEAALLCDTAPPPEPAPAPRASPRLIIEALASAISEPAPPEDEVPAPLAAAADAARAAWRARAAQLAPWESLDTLGPEPEGSALPSPSPPPTHSGIAAGDTNSLCDI